MNSNKLKTGKISIVKEVVSISKVTGAEEINKVVVNEARQINRVMFKEIELTNKVIVKEAGQISTAKEVNSHIIVSQARSRMLLILKSGFSRKNSKLHQKTVSQAHLKMPLISKRRPNHRIIKVNRRIDKTKAQEKANRPKFLV